MRTFFITFSLCFIFNTLFSQDLKIESEYSSLVFGNKCAKRDLFNYFRMLDMSNSSFENQIKPLGVNISYGEDFSIIAHEQISMDATATGWGTQCIYSFVKGDKYLSVIWYGIPEQSCFKNLVDEISKHFIETKDGKKVYGIAVGKKNYLVTIERKLKSSTSSEILTIYKISDTEK